MRCGLSAKHAEHVGLLIRQIARTYKRAADDERHGERARPVVEAEDAHDGRLGGRDVLLDHPGEPLQRLPLHRGEAAEVVLTLSESVGWQNFGKMLLVFGCIGTDFCKKICVLQHFSKSTRLSS